MEPKVRNIRCSKSITKLKYFHQIVIFLYVKRIKLLENRMADEINRQLNTYKHKHVI